MSTVRRRRLAATALATTAALTLVGCGTGFNAQTNQVYQAGTGANHHGDIDVLNTLFVANDDKSATLSAAIVNHTDAKDSLESVTVTSLAGKELPVSSAESPLSLPAGGLTTVGGTANAAGAFRLTTATPGSYVKVTLSFSKSAPVTIEAPVVTRTPEYDKVAGPAPTPTSTAAAKAEEEAKGTDGTEGTG